jgi:hypothetical protein
MKKQIGFIVLLGLMLGLPKPQFAQDSQRDKGFNTITKEAIQGQLEFLASDWMEGRETGTKGAYMAADYIASMFKLYGLEPGGDPEQMRFGRGMRPMGGNPQQQRAERPKTYFQNFDLVVTSAGDDQELSVITKSGGSTHSVDFNYRTDFTINPGQTGIEAEVPVVFVGYGLTDEKNGYDDFKGLDLKGKIVVKLNGFPGWKDVNSKTYDKFKPTTNDNNQADRRMMFRRGFNRYPWATEKGVMAVIELRDGQDPTTQWASNIPFRYNTSTYEGDVPQETRPRESWTLTTDQLRQGLISLTVTDRVIQELTNGLNMDFDAIEKQIAETGKPASRELTGKFIHLKTSVKSRIVRARNVVGVLEGKNPDEIIVIGGHYDHLGKYGGFVFNGADDNGSGTVGVMTIARAFAESGIKPEKTLVFCAWTGEEEGLLGSKYFTGHPYPGKILCELNYDMISRSSPIEDQDNKITMNYSNAFPVSKDLVEKFNKDYDMGLDIDFKGSDRPGGGSDHASFANIDVPIYYFTAYTTRMPSEYHKFNDQVETLNWDKMLKIVQLGYLSIFELAKMPWNE